MASLWFDEGKDFVVQQGWPTTVWFMLSEYGVLLPGPQHQAGDMLAGGLGEIAGSGYRRASQLLPVPSAGLLEFEMISWDPKPDWSREVRSVVAVSSRAGDGVAIVAWDLDEVRDLSQSVIEETTPVFQT